MAMTNETIEIRCEAVTQVAREMYGVPVQGSVWEVDGVSAYSFELDGVPLITIPADAPLQNTLKTVGALALARRTRWLQ